MVDSRADSTWYMRVGFLALSRPEKGMVPENFKNPKRHRCPMCLHVGGLLTDKRNAYGEDDPLMDYSRRRRGCKKCGHRWSTVEVHARFYDLMKRVGRELKKREKNHTPGRAQADQREKLREAVRKIEQRT